jgi:hypothetical protein
MKPEQPITINPPRAAVLVVVAGKQPLVKRHDSQQPLLRVDEILQRTAEYQQRHIGKQ